MSRVPEPTAPLDSPGSQPKPWTLRRIIGWAARGLAIGLVLGAIGGGLYIVADLVDVPRFLWSRLLSVYYRSLLVPLTLFIGALLGLAFALAGMQAYALHKIPKRIHPLRLLAEGFVRVMLVGVSIGLILISLLGIILLVFVVIDNANSLHVVLIQAIIPGLSVGVISALIVSLIAALINLPPPHWLKGIRRAHVTPYILLSLACGFAFVLLLAPPYTLIPAKTTILITLIPLLAAVIVGYPIGLATDRLPDVEAPRWCWSWHGARLGLLVTVMIGLIALFDFSLHYDRYRFGNHIDAEVQIADLEHDLQITRDRIAELQASWDVSGAELGSAWAALGPQIVERVTLDYYHWNPVSFATDIADSRTENCTRFVDFSYSNSHDEANVRIAYWENERAARVAELDRQLAAYLPADQMAVLLETQRKMLQCWDQAGHLDRLIYNYRLVTRDGISALLVERLLILLLVGAGLILGGGVIGGISLHRPAPGSGRRGQQPLTQVRQQRSNEGVGGHGLTACECSIQVPAVHPRTQIAKERIDREPLHSRNALGEDQADQFP